MENPFLDAFTGQGSAGKIDAVLSSSRAHTEKGMGAVGKADEAEMAEMLIDFARDKGLKIACAESLTGGLIAASLVKIPGASDVFLGGVVTYTDAMKTKVLGVDKLLLSQKTAYCPEVALAMASGAGKLFGADLILSSTGVAGPGPDMGHEPGTGFLGCVTPYTMQVWPVTVPGKERTDVREAFTRGALMLALQTMAHDVDKGH